MCLGAVSHFVLSDADRSECPLNRCTGADENSYLYTSYQTRHTKHVISIHIILYTSYYTRHTIHVISIHVISIHVILSRHTIYVISIHIILYTSSYHTCHAIRIISHVIPYITHTCQITLILYNAFGILTLSHYHVIAVHYHVIVPRHPTTSSYLIHLSVARECGVCHNSFPAACVCPRPPNYDTVAREGRIEISFHHTSSHDHEHHHQT